MQDVQDEPPRSTLIVRRLLTLFVVVATTNVLVLAVEGVLYAPFRVPSDSMRPVLEKGDRIAVSRRTDLDDLKRGDIIVFAMRADQPGQFATDPSAGPRQLLVKRVIALPNETVEAYEGTIAIDGTQRLEEPYILGEERGVTFDLVPLEEDEVWVMGDNRSDSSDSREFGPVPRSAILGRVAFRWWPPSRWTSF